MAHSIKAVRTRRESKYSSAIARAAEQWKSYRLLMRSTPALASSAVEKAWMPAPVGSQDVNPVSWTNAGRPLARYEQVRSLKNVCDRLERFH